MRPMLFAAAITLLLASPTFADPISTPEHSVPALGSDFEGNAHWYGGQFHGRRTASGAIFDKTKLTAAHPSLPFGTKVLVHSKYSGKDVVVEVTDRCPKLSQRCIDVSEGAARQLGIYPGAPNGVKCSVVTADVKAAKSQMASPKQP